jgi:hypothetical protein
LTGRLALALALLALTSGEVALAQQAAEQQQERPRRRPPLAAVGDPGRVAAFDGRFARTAREEGQWTAFARFAASDAVLHQPGAAPFDAAPWLAAQSNPPEAVAWQPTAVWASCDGSLAVSFGRFRQPDGMMGSYATVWALQGDREYRYTYDMGGLDVPQPPPPPPRVPPSDEVIVVPGLGLIDGKVADCPRGPAPAVPLATVEDGAQYGGALSADGTLFWRWEHSANGARRVKVTWLRDGRWQTALDFGFAADGSRLAGGR